MPKRLIGALGFSLGTCLVMNQAALLPTALTVGLAMFGLMILLTGRGLLASTILLGWVWANALALQGAYSALAPKVLGVPLQASGTVVGIPRHDNFSTRFDFLLTTFYSDGAGYPCRAKIRLRWYGGARSLRPGDKWRLWIKVKSPRGYRNAYGFDYERHLFRKGIVASGYVIDNGSVAHQYLGADHNIDRFRGVLMERLAVGMRDVTEPGILTALAMGERSGISQEQQRLLRRSGLAHLIAISGLHVGLAGMLGFLLASWAWRLSGNLCGLYPARFAGIWVGVTFALGYTALAGFPISSTRAFIMVGVGALLAMNLRRSDPQNVLASAMLSVAVFRPLLVSTPGFWLSFAAVWYIFHFTSTSAVDLKTSEKGGSSASHTTNRCNPFGRMGVYLKDLLWLQVFLLFGLAPFLIFWFEELAIFSIFTNLLAVPAFSFVVVPLVLGALGANFFELNELAGLLLQGAGAVVSWVLSVARIATSLPGAVLKLSSEWGILMAASLVVMLVQKRWSNRVLSAALVFALVVGGWGLSAADRPGPGQFQLTMLDVGQGLAVVVYLHDHVLLYDTGPRYGNFSLGATVIAPQLSGRGVKAIDAVVLSHSSNDHAGGLAGTQREVLIRRLFSGEARKTGGVDCLHQPPWIWDGVRFEFLQSRPARTRNVNNYSCVLKITGYSGSALLTGDIEQASERALVERYGKTLEVDVLQVPHHGSKTSSTKTFLSAVNPEYGLLSRGIKNRFGHPRPEVLARYRKLGIRVLDTAPHGQITLRTTLSGWQVETFADRRLRFWHRPASQGEPVYLGQDR